MEYIGDRISIKRSENELSIVVVSFRNKFKNTLLFAWFFLWTVCGIVVLTQYFTAVDENAKAVVLVWLGFWAYFEYKVFKAFMWRKFGVEKIKIRGNKFFYKRDVSGKGKVHVYDFDFIKDIRSVAVSDKSFVDTINNSYWSLSGEKIAFDYNGKEIKFAIQLNEPEVKDLLKIIQKEIKKS